jgi:hypothetical protein
VQLSERRRPSRPPGGDLELVLRGLVYALIIQSAAALSTWLPHLAHKLTHGHITDHFSALAAYALVVCVAVPTVIGLLLGTWLRNAESGGPLKWWHYALGGRDARRAWDYAFSQHDGSWVRVVLRDAPPDAPTAFLGKFGRRSWAAQSPSDPDLYLQDVWPTGDDGRISEEQLQQGSQGSMWISADQIARIELLPENE